MEPKNAKDIREIVEGRLRAVSQSSGLQETHTIEWRESSISIPVISMPVTSLYYNPETHRVRAQRELYPDRLQNLLDDPFGPVAQEYLGSLLMGDPANPTQIDPAFEKLKSDLIEHGQRDPGIITRSGVLINGNTRRAALLGAGKENIRVAVLPPDASATDIQAVELSLQLRKDLRREYSFVNQLLAMQDRINSGVSEKEIQGAFRITKKTFDRQVWILNLIKDLIKRSTTTSGDGSTVQLKLVDFENDKGKLEELYAAFVSEKERSSDSANLLLEQRLVGLILGNSKTDLRLVGPEFLAESAPDLIPKDFVWDGKDSSIRLPGTDITIDSSSPENRPVKQLADKTLKLGALANAKNQLNPTQVIDASNKLKEMREVFDRGVEREHRKFRQTKRRLQSLELISDANDNLRQAVSSMNSARATGTLELEDLEDQFAALKENLESVSRIISRENPDPESKAAWVIRASQA